MAIDFSRRDFLKKTGLLAGGAGIFSALPGTVQKAMAINPAKGSTFEDAEHIVLLMQENRSFDHCFGALRGVRGFNDPRTLKLSNGNPVWLQTNKAGQSYLPFRLDMQNTKVTWMGGLPHTWKDQVDARNYGKYDQWLNAKKTGYKGFEDKPMTLGYYTREDLPFNYALADAFTVCDQHFCSSLTGTTPNRLYFWSGALRKDGLAENPALVRNNEADHNAEVDWKTLPELLQENGISWKVYQNELSIPSGLSDEEEAWLGNFTDNDLEWFSQYHVRRSKKYESYLSSKLNEYDKSLAELKGRLDKNPGDEKVQRVWKGLDERKKYYIKELDRCREELKKQLSDHEEALHNNAFVTNEADPDYHSLEEIEYDHKGTKRKMRVPKSDVLANFRNDVKGGKLPAVSWLVAPQYFSDHPSAPWFGAWYVSEILNILTHNEEVWKKTIFILTYDENDGYFDHVLPFVAPDYRNPDTGAVSAGIRNIANEFVTMDDEIHQKKVSQKNAREHAIGLGYRVPFIVASPWSRGGYVNSQVFDHTSVVQFIEKFASRKTGKKLALSNVSDFRRAVCGDLSSVFRPYNGEKMRQPDYLERDIYLQQIDEARYTPAPEGIHPVDEKETQVLRQNPAATKKYFRQEAGTKPSAALPYELYADGVVENNKMLFNFSAGKALFKERSAGFPLVLYAYEPYAITGNAKKEINRNWSFAIAPGEQLAYEVPLDGFATGSYHFALFGPNGFFRELKGNSGNATAIHTSFSYELITLKNKRQIRLSINNSSGKPIEVYVKDNSYGQPIIKRMVAAKSTAVLILPVDKSGGWYDFSVLQANNKAFERRYAGRVENGKDSISDPAMG
jgi:phospholipase C